jgi:hypothetical protein
MKLVNVKTQEIAGDRHSVYFDLFNPRSRGTPSYRHLESMQRLAVSLGDRLDATVGQVADNARQTFSACHILSEVTKTDARHPTAHHKSASHPHPRILPEPRVPNRVTNNTSRDILRRRPPFANLVL